MYHRFNENKYPSTNIKMDIFEKQINIIKKNNYKFYDLNEFNVEYSNPKKEKKILITIDDAFSSFYENAWPFLKENKIPFILFVSTEPVGKKGYMTWEQIKEIEKEKFVYIGNHSHSHEYLINYDFSKISTAPRRSKSPGIPPLESPTTAVLLSIATEQPKSLELGELPLTRLTMFHVWV